MKQITDAVRVQLVGWPLRYLFPLALGLLIGLLQVAVWAFIPVGATGPDPRITGGALAIYITAGTVYLTSINQTFPFALGFGVTRRAFYGAVLVLVVVESMAYGLLIMLIGLAERATGGWGVQVQLVDLLYLRQDNPLLQWLLYTVPFIAMAALFAFLGVTYKRWGPVGLWTLLLGWTFVLGGLTLAVTWYGWWPAVGQWFVEQSPLALIAGYPLALAAAALGIGWLAIRRATP